jgi:hypothetical protein
LSLLFTNQNVHLRSFEDSSLRLYSSRSHSVESLLRLSIMAPQAWSGTKHGGYRLVSSIIAGNIPSTDYDIQGFNLWCQSSFSHFYHSCRKVLDGKSTLYIQYTFAHRTLRLIARDRHDAARHSLRRLRATEDIEQELAVLEAAPLNHEKGPWSELFKGDNRVCSAF